MNELKPAETHPGTEEDTCSGFLNPFNDIAVSEHHLPHWQQEDCFVFVTWRLADALPRATLLAWEEEKELFLNAHPQPWDPRTESTFHRRFSDRVDRWLDAGSGSCLLREPQYARLVANALFFFHEQRYDLDAFVVMPTHVHVLFQLRSPHTLGEVLHSWKSFTAKQLLKAQGPHARSPVWQQDYWDRLIRNEAHLRACRAYIRDNPRKAGVRQGEYVLWERER